MNISRISTSTPFRSHFTNVDIGASSILGSLKISAISDENRVIAKERLTVFDEDEKRSESAFEKNVARKVADFEKRHEKEILKADKENKTKLTVCYPGPGVKTKNNTSGFLVSNFFYDDHRRNRFKRPINPSIIDKSLKSYGVKVLQSRHTNDMSGAGACLLSKIQTSCPEILEEGEEILYLYPGGGLGTGVIMVDKDNYKVKPSEIQHIIKNRTFNDSVENDVRAASLRKNFADALRIRDAESALIGENTKAVTDYAELKAILPYITKREHAKASKEAMSKFMDSLAQMIATKVCESKLHTVVITGPIANGVHDAVNANKLFKKRTSDKENDNFRATLMKKVVDNLSKVGQKLLYQNPDIKIVFLKIADNTDGAHLLQNGEAVGNPAVWYNINK